MKEREPLCVNNFIDVYVEPSKVKPPHLEEYEIISDYQIYRSTFDTSLYIIYDDEKEEYHVLRDEGSEDVEDDLEKNIAVRIIPKTKPLE